MPVGEDNSDPESSVTDVMAKLEVGDKTESERLHLTTLPGEIHLRIFDLLDDDPEVSACLGLTCKKLYPLFFARHVKTKLYRRCEDCKKVKIYRYRGSLRCDNCRGLGPVQNQLYFLLRDWVGPQLQFSPYCLKFITPEAELDIQKKICVKINGELCSVARLLRCINHGCRNCRAVVENQCFDAGWKFNSSFAADFPFPEMVKRVD